MATVITASDIKAESLRQRSCGSRIDALTAETIIPTYRDVRGHASGVSSFYSSIPVEGPAWVRSEDGKLVVAEPFMAHIEYCIERLKHLLLPRAEAGDAEAQYILGRLLLDAYINTRGGPAGYSENRSEARRQAHQWLVKAMEAGNCEAKWEITAFYQWQLGYALYKSQSHELSEESEHPWLPKPRELLAWLEEESRKGDAEASRTLMMHYFARLMHARLGDHDQAHNRYELLFGQYATLWKKQLEAAPTPLVCPKLFKRSSR